MNARRAILSGVVGTAAVTALWLLEPLVGLPRLAVGSMLSSLLAVATAYLAILPVVGWAIHVLVGVGLALVYAGVFAHRLPGSVWARGAIYGAGIFVFAQLTFMPLVGAGVFSRGDLPMLLGSLLGHLVYGAIVASIYGDPSVRREVTMS